MLCHSLQLLAFPSQSASIPWWHRVKILTMDLASLYIILGSISFITSVVTLGVLIKKFIEQPAAHGFFVYSDTIASALLSLGLLLDGVQLTVKTFKNTLVKEAST